MAAGMPSCAFLEGVPDAPAGSLPSFCPATGPHGQAAFNTLLPNGYY